VKNNFFKEHGYKIFKWCFIALIIIALVVLAIIFRKPIMGLVGSFTALFGGLFDNTEDRKRKRIEDKIKKLQDKINYNEVKSDDKSLEIEKLKKELEKIKQEKKDLITKLQEIQKQNPNTISDEEINDYLSNL
jgi:septal ring factor EnvC (AmiA/AmiB activator)